MTVSTYQYPVIGGQPIMNSASSIEVADNDTLYRPIIPVGTVIDYIDPYYGAGKAIRLCVPKNTTAIKTGTLSLYAAATNAGVLSNYSYVIVPSTAGQNKPFAVALQAIPLNATLAQYAWFGIQGTSPLWSLAATAITDKMHISATAGAAFVTPTLGKCLIGMNPVVASTGTVAKQCSTVNGSPVLTVSNSDGWFVGQSVAGVNIATSLILSIDVTGTKVTLASNATATGTSTATATNNDATNFFPICQYAFPTLQFTAT